MKHRIGITPSKLVPHMLRLFLQLFLPLQLLLLSLLPHMQLLVYVPISLGSSVFSVNDYLLSASFGLGSYLVFVVSICVDLAVGVGECIASVVHFRPFFVLLNLFLE